MRFDTTQTITAYQVVNEYSEHSLADIIFRLGEERRATRIARAIIRQRPIDSTTQLADTITRSLGPAARSRTHPATRTFQAIRMAVNKELENLEHGLEGAINVLRTGGRLVAISYHSLEDRLVKSTLRREASACVCPPGTPVCVCGHTASVRLVDRRVIRPTPSEVAANRRSRSARMRVAEAI
jgi:16S rRNA (cytosine1402-N4)-methyltransferase